MKKYLFPVLMTIMLAVLLAACGAQGSEGMQGPAGPAGPVGPVGPAGEDASAIQDFVGSERCGDCHTDQYASFILSAHPHNLKTVNGEAPVFPFDDKTGGLVEPPAGYTWDDISYVVGGFAWAAHFVDADGYMITGDEAKYAFPNRTTDFEGGWLATPEEAAEFYCAACHSTGYAPFGSQDGLEGAIGTWAMDGVQCEACHGPGSDHAENPTRVEMTVNTSAQACGDCHVRGEEYQISGADGFGDHNQQFEELATSKHLALDCVGCHDPHSSAVYESDANPHQGIVTECADCHYEQTAKKVSAHTDSFVTCATCHMPPLDKSASANPDNLTGDVSAHLFAINTDPDAEQFLDSTTLAPYLTVEYVCSQCHSEAGLASVKDAATLYSAATDYHNPAPPAAEPAAEDNN